uniref:Uncharacterized protein n=1 Tax=Melopsittacus undulatus TaxID=13146 RepID=A0A8V5GY23_MELUD
IADEAGAARSLLQILTLSSGLSQDTVLARPGANITLRCWDQAPANITVSWRAEHRGRRQRLPSGNALPLHCLRPDDSGTYGCFVGSRRLRSLRLLVQDPPEPPRVSCSRRSHDHDVLCEWALREKPAPGTRAMLWVKQRFTAGNATEQRCRFFSKALKFVCRVKVPHGADDTKPFLVSACVSNGAGSAAGEDKIITLNGVLRPDPPLNVTVTALEGAPQRLRVNWSYPSSWDHRFYWLRFQVRYRPEPAHTFSEVDQVTTTWLDIHDAWRGLRHVVQVRAQEEFGHGAWSEWSREAVGTPWTGRRGGRVALSLGFPMEDGTYGLTLPPELFVEDDAGGTGGEEEALGGQWGSTSPYPFLAVGGSLLLAIALCIGIVLRYRQLWRRGGWGGAKPEGEGQHGLVALGSPQPLLHDPPCSSGHGGLHVTSLDYFFSGQ